MRSSASRFRVVLLSTLLCASALSSVVHANPATFLDVKITDLKKQISGRGAIVRADIEIDTRATRNRWLDAIYDSNLVEASTLTRHLSDKLIMARLIEAYAGEKGSTFYPKTVGLKDFLSRNGLLDKQKELIRDEVKIAAAIAKEFPHGAIVKPAAGINSAGKGKKFFFKVDKFIAALVSPESDLYRAANFDVPHVSELLKIAASGEELILQENVVTAAGTQKVLLTKEFKEVRVHTYEDKVVSGATYARWAEMKNIDGEMANQVNSFVQSFLDLFPKEFLTRNAFSMDVAVMDNGVMRILDINTNRGDPIQWSGYMPRPGVLKAYTIHFENEKKAHFTGLSGVLLRFGWANQFKYWKKVYIEGIH